MKTPTQIHKEPQGHAWPLMKTPTQIAAEAAQKLAEALRKRYEDDVIGIANYVAIEGTAFIQAAMEEAREQDKENIRQLHEKHQALVSENVVLRRTSRAAHASEQRQEKWTEETVMRIYVNSGGRPSGFDKGFQAIADAHNAALPRQQGQDKWTESDVDPDRIECNGKTVGYASNPTQRKNIIAAHNAALQ